MLRARDRHVARSGSQLSAIKRDHGSYPSEQPVTSRGERQMRRNSLHAGPAPDYLAACDFLLQ